jgi:hypothetical protein
VGYRDDGDRSNLAIARSKATKQCILSHGVLALWIASQSLSSGAHSRDPLARNDAEGSSRGYRYTTTLSRFAARVMPV